MNIYITCFSLNEPSNHLLYYFYIVFVYFVYMFFCLTSNPRKLY